MQGVIIRAISGFYTVSDGCNRLTCKPKGRFRYESLSPLVGDRVVFSAGENGSGVIEEILPRKNSFIRPAVANVDLMIFVASAVNPVTDPFLIDRVSVIAENADCAFALCINKCDLDRADSLYSIYRQTDFPLILASAEDGEGLQEIRDLMQGKISVLTGNSGVGKSSLLNRLMPELNIETDAVSTRLGRGKHTTRHVELYPLDNDTFAADTPGFASFEVGMVDRIEKEQLAGLFPEFHPCLGHCRFNDCRHLNEPGCTVLEQVRDGTIAPSRHASYARLYELISSAKQY
jgi:ribosome biogenesis GTPase